MAAAGGLSQSNFGFLPVSLAIIWYCMPISTLSGIFKVFLMAGTKVSDLMFLQEYIIQPMHSDLAAWHGLGCRWIVILCFELVNWSCSSCPNVLGATGCVVGDIRRRLRYTLLTSAFGFT